MLPPQFAPCPRRRLYRPLTSNLAHSAVLDNMAPGLRHDHDPVHGPLHKDTRLSPQGPDDHANLHVGGVLGGKDSGNGGALTVLQTGHCSHWRHVLHDTHLRQPGLPHTQRVIYPDAQGAHTTRTDCVLGNSTAKRHQSTDNLCRRPLPWRSSLRRGPLASRRQT